MHILDRKCLDPLTSSIGNEDKRYPSVFQGFQALSCSGQDFGATYQDTVNVERLLPAQAAAAVVARMAIDRRFGVLRGVTT